MINQFEVPGYMKEALPEIGATLQQVNDPANAYQSIRLLLDFTIQKLHEHNLNLVKQCFKLAEKLYTKGNGMVKCAVENVFVFAFSRLPIENPSERKTVMGLIPGTLYTCYLQQVHHSSI